MRTKFLGCIILVIFINFTQAKNSTNVAKISSDREKRDVKQQTNADQMVQNILQWLQGVYIQNSRKVRQGTIREYLPPNANTQKPRPFEPARPGTYLPPLRPGEKPSEGYPPAGSITPQPPFPIYTNPITGGITGEGQYPSGNGGQSPSGPEEGYTQSSQPQPPFTEGPSTPEPTTKYPVRPSDRPGYYPTGGYPTSRPTDYPTGRPTGGFPTGRPTDFPTGRPTGGYPTGRPTDYPTGRPTGGYPTGRPTDYPTGRPSGGYPTGRPTDYPTGRPTGGYPTGRPTDYPTGRPTGGYPTGRPTEYPTGRPTGGYPTGRPTDFPTGRPTGGYPTGRPTDYPTGRPTGGYPTGRPTGGYPTGRPTDYPTGRPNGGYPTGRPAGYPTGRPTDYPPSIPSNGYPTDKPSGEYPTGKPTGGYPTDRPTDGPYDGFSTSKPNGQYPTQRPTGGYPTDYPTGRPTGGYPTGRPTDLPTRRPPSGYPTGRPTDYPTDRPTGPTTGSPTEFTTKRPSGFPTGAPPGYPTNGPTDSGTVGPTGRPTLRPQPPGTTSTPGVTDGKVPDDNNLIPVTSLPPTEEDLKHPPHIHDIQVDCAKEMMTITIEFNRIFNGVIYSKGFYNNPECVYVSENSNQIKYTFTVRLDSCGSEFINAFDTQGQSYLENVLVIQNEAGVQEIWDTIRAVRCLWEGNIKETLSVGFSVGMLTQEIVTFSGDTAMARLDLQLGRGPFAPAANGLVKIGEMMTLVVSVTGDPGFDIQVQDCRARDASGEKVIQLTDQDGCILKPKLFGAFQKTRDTGNTGASIIAYAYFNAFRLPDIMDMMLECNIELCKTDCEVCPNPNQLLEPGKKRRKRDLNSNNTISNGVLMGRKYQVIVPEDLSKGEAIININSEKENICLTTGEFMLASSLLVSLLTISCFISSYLWLKSQRLQMKV